MKIFYSLSIICFSGIQAYSQTGVAWSVPENVGTGSIHSNVYPRITLTAGDIPLVVWEDASPAKVYSARKTGGVFSAPLTVNPSGISPFVASYAGAEVSSSGDTAFVVFTSMPVLSGKCYIVRSIDGGISWSDTVRVDQDSAKIPNFPSVAVMPGGNPVVSYMIADDGTMINTEYVTVRSTDGGTTFSPSVIPVNPGNVCDCCPASMAISGNNLALLYRNNISNIRDMWSSFSTDGGITYSTSAEIDTTNWFLTSCPSSGPSGVIVGDSLIYTWMSSATGNSRIYLGTMNINDQMLGQHRQVYPYGTSAQNNPIIAGSGDTLGLVWLGYKGTSQEVLFTWSVTGAGGLGINVDTLTAALTGNQSRPDLVYKNGKFRLVYSNSVGTQVQYMEGILTNSLGITDDASPDLFTIYPNPAHDDINLKFYSLSEPGKIRMSNILGEEILKDEIRPGTELLSLNVKGFSPGVYFIRLQSGSSISSKKVVIGN